MAKERGEQTYSGWAACCFIQKIYKEIRATVWPSLDRGSPNSLWLGKRGNGFQQTQNNS